MENRTIRGDRLLLALHVIALGSRVGSWWYNDDNTLGWPPDGWTLASGENPRGLNGQAVVEFLVPFAQKAGTPFVLRDEHGEGAYNELLYYLHKFLEKNASRISTTLFEIASVAEGTQDVALGKETNRQRNQFLGLVLVAIASGEITEKMLKEPETEAATSA